MSTAKQTEKQHSPLYDRFFSFDTFISWSFFTASNSASDVTTPQCRTPLKRSSCFSAFNPANAPSSKTTFSPSVRLGRFTSFNSEWFLNALLLITSSVNAGRSNHHLTSPHPLRNSVVLFPSSNRFGSPPHAPAPTHTRSSFGKSALSHPPTTPTFYGHRLHLREAVVAHSQRRQRRQVHHAQRLRPIEAVAVHLHIGIRIADAQFGQRRQVYSSPLHASPTAQHQLHKVHTRPALDAHLAQHCFTV